MNSAPEISIVVPIYNAASTLEKTLNSVFEQTFGGWELILVDDCSTDSSAEIGQIYARSDKRVTYIRLRKNSGTPSVPRNKGVSVASGKYIAFLDADDLWCSNKLAIQLDLLRDSGARMVSTGMINFSNEVPKVCPNVVTTTKTSLLKQLIKYRTPLSSWVCCRTVFESFKFNENKKLSGREDLLLSLQLHAKYGTSLKIKEPLIFYRVHKNQISKNKIKMGFAVFKIIFFADLGSQNWLKIFMPIFVFSNIFLSLYWRVFRNRL